MGGILDGRLKTKIAGRISGLEQELEARREAPDIDFSASPLKGTT